MLYTRAKLNFEVNNPIDFVKDINSDGTTERWMLENFDGSLRVNARSLLGVVYAVAEWNNEIYLVNATHEECVFPNFVDKYRD